MIKANLKKIPTTIFTPLGMWLPASLIISFASIYLNIFSSIRLDEAQSIWASTKTVPGILKYIAQDVHVPLYTLLLHFWMQIFGTQLIVVRLLSVIFFLLSIPAMFYLSNLTGGKRVALIATNLFVLSPFLIWYGTETRMYSLLTLITLVSHIAFLQMINSHLTQRKLAFLLTSIIGIYTHYFFSVVILLQCLYFVIVYLNNLPHQQNPIIKSKISSQIKTHLNNLLLNKKQILLFTGLIILVGLSFLPWIWFVFNQGNAANTKPLLSPPSSYNLLQLFIHFFTGFQIQTLQSLMIAFWPLTVILFFLSFNRQVKLDKLLSTSYYLVMSFGPIILALLVSYTIQPILVSRYLIFVTPAIFYLIAIVLANFNQRMLLLIVTGILISNVYFQYQQSTSSQIKEKENYQQVTEYLNSETKDSDIIAISAPFTVYPIEYQYQGQAKIETIPKWDRYKSGSMGEFSQNNLQQQFEDYQKKYQRLFLVLSYDQGYELEIKSYFNNRLEMINQKTFSPQIEVFEYRLPQSYISDNS
jgi:uncharacterized membrane protein